MRIVQDFLPSFVVEMFFIRVKENTSLTNYRRTLSMLDFLVFIPLVTAL